MKFESNITPPRRRTLIVGAGSYLARHFLAHIEHLSCITATSHEAVTNANFADVKTLINFACDPNYHILPYDISLDFDARLMEKVSRRGVHYIFFSSRKVYQPAMHISENAVLDGQGDYGMNKIITEDLIRQHFPGCHTILRVGNILGHGMKPHTFVGEAIRTLRSEKKIVLDIAPETVRDFLPVDDFVHALVRIMKIRPVGTFNLASGIPTQVGQVAAWIVDGYGKGKVISSSEEVRDTFTLDVSCIESIVGPICVERSIETICKEIGMKIDNG